MSTAVFDREQSMRALDRANAVRTDRACLKRALASQEPAEAALELAGLIELADERVATMRLLELLLAVRRIGVSKAHRILSRAGRGQPIGGMLRVGDLGFSRRQAVASELRGFARSWSS